ncbi:MAG: BrnT family toxin [Bdellovibrionaceae bacterium]|nr:BrnT family toxin [Pseudobdellovibrionaceae bacterium]
MQFEWDEHKAVSNFKKHKVRFEIAITVFDDPYALIAPDEKHSTGKEKRDWIIGESDKGILVIVFTKKNTRNYIPYN